MGSAILALLVALAPAIVEILKAILRQSAQEAQTHEALTEHSLDELHTATDGKLRDQTPVQ